MLKVVIPVLPGVLDLSLGITLDVLQTANRLRVQAGRKPLFDITLAGAGGRRVRTGAGLQVGPLAALRDQPVPKLVVLPGSNQPTPDAIERWFALREVLRACDWLQLASAGGAQFAASCVGSFALAHAGLLDGRMATTSWWLAPYLRQRYPRVQLDMDQMVVFDGPVMTAGAALAQADLMLAVVTRWGSMDLAGDCARFLLLDRRVTQSQYAMTSHLAQQTPVMQRAHRWIQSHLAQPIALADLAEALHMTPRTLSRHFAAALGLSPIQYVQRLRIERAQHLLETSSEPLDRIAAQVGYADGSMLRKLLAREQGSTPSSLRASRRVRQALAVRPQASR